MKNLMIVSLILVTSLAHAGRVDKREQRQAARIQKGIDNGSLNQAEVKRLEAQQRRIDSVENRVAADGKVTKKEALHMENMQDRASRNIHHQKHDKQ